MRSGNGRASAEPATMHTAATHSVKGRPNSPDSAPQMAEPMAKLPSAPTVCSAIARARTQGGALDWVAVLKVDIAAIQQAPPMASARYTAGGQRTSAATAITPPYTTQPPLTMTSSPRRARSGPMTRPMATAPPPRQAISRP